MNRQSSTTDPPLGPETGPPHGPVNPPLGAQQAENSPEIQVDTLKEIVGEIERFLGQWMQRFDHLLQQCQDQTKQDVAMQQQLADLDQQRRQWEAQRQRDAQELHEKAEQLTEAWLRLEGEQRALLQAQASLKHRNPDGLNSPGTLSQCCGNARTNDHRPDSPAPLEPVGPAASPAGLSHQAAAEQFEILRREIGNHTSHGR